MSANTFARETRFYITSLAWTAEQIGPAVRAHWMIENGLHRVIDMTSATINVACAPIMHPPFHDQQAHGPNLKERTRTVPHVSMAEELAQEARLEEQREWHWRDPNRSALRTILPRE